MGGCELGMCKEVSWEEAVEVLKCLKGWKALGNFKIEGTLWWRKVGGWMMNLVVGIESCPAEWKRSLLVPFHMDGDNEEVENYWGIVVAWQGYL